MPEQLPVNTNLLTLPQVIGLNFSFGGVRMDKAKPIQVLGT